ncbi:hypothetical protein OC844_003101 [Tilletia horrida]|nr:hypothetical protein OC844_003101 [Tilletia horrida]
MGLHVPAKFFIPLLVVGMLATGVANSIFNKYQDLQCVAHCDPKDPRPRRNFESPVFQTFTMFLGESLCLFPVGIRILYTHLVRVYAGRNASGAAGPASKNANGATYTAVPTAEPADLEASVLSSAGGGRGGYSTAESDTEGGAGTGRLERSDYFSSETDTDTEAVAGAGAGAAPAGRKRPTFALPDSPAEGGPSRARARTMDASVSSVDSVTAPDNRAGSRSRPPLSTRRSSKPRRSLSRRRSYKVEPEELPLVGKAIFLFFTPALCDICGTTLMNVGLIFTPVSIYQMTRGALVLWVGVFSVFFLHRHLKLFQWLSLLTVMAGVCVVGLSGTLLSGNTPSEDSLSHALAAANTTNPDAALVPMSIGAPAFRAAQEYINEPLWTTRSSASASAPIFHTREEAELPEAAQALLGVLLILFAQLFTAGQFVLEEKIMSKYSVEPLLAVGYEGAFGAVSVAAAAPFLYYFIGRTPDGQGGYFDFVECWAQVRGSAQIFWSSFAIMLSIALFNFFGLSVTRSISATARSTIDTSRTIGIWIVSLLLGWEVFKPLNGSLQVLGFALLVYGTFVFNGIIQPPKFLRPPSPPPRPPLRRGRSSRYRSSRPRTKSLPGPTSGDEDGAADATGESQQRPSLERTRTEPPTGELVPTETESGDRL